MKTLLPHAFRQRFALALRIGLFLAIVSIGRSAHAQDPCTTQYNACMAQADSDYYDCFDNASGAGQRHACEVSLLNTQQGCTTARNACQAPPTITGFINPKFIIVGLTYAPPGPSSSVTYGSSTLVGSTTDQSSSFSNGTTVSITVGNDIGAWSVLGGAGVKTSATTSTNLTQGSNTTSSVTVSKTTSFSQTTAGVTFDAYNPVNHDYDLIWLWLNPLMIYTVNPNVPNSLQWNGYGYDPNDIPETDIYPVYLGYLNGHFTQSPSVANVLARSWASNQSWPTGQGPGLDANDKAQIAAADPFSNGSYSLGSPLPTTSADGRFTLAALTQDIPYVQGGPGSSGGPSSTYSLSNTQTSSQGQGVSYSYSQSFGTDVGFSGGTFFGTWHYNLAVQDQITMATKWQNTLTSTSTHTNNLTIVGPPCSATTIPCVPTYTGPGEFIIYQDNLYGTFMFYPH